MLKFALWKGTAGSLYPFIAEFCIRFQVSSSQLHFEAVHVSGTEF